MEFKLLNSSVLDIVCVSQLLAINILYSEYLTSPKHLVLTAIPWY